LPTTRIPNLPTLSSTTRSTSTTTQSQIQPHLVGISAPLVHTAKPIAAVATVGFDVVENILLITWQDANAREMFVSALETNTNMRSWQVVDKPLIAAEKQIKEACSGEHYCTITGISQRCQNVACGQQDLTQYCCTCRRSTDPGCGIICSTPPTGSQDPIYNPLFPTGRQIGSVWTFPFPFPYPEYVYFAVSPNTCAPSKLTDYTAVILLDGLHPNGYPFPQIPVCTGSATCRILSMTSTPLTGSTRMLFGAVVCTSSQTLFCVFQSDPPPMIEPTPVFQWCTQEMHSIQSGSDRITVTVNRNNNIWYVVDTNADGNGKQFVVYTIDSSAVFHASAKIDFIGISGLNSIFNTFIGQTTFENSLIIVLQSSDMQHIVLKYQIY
jgi:hypothetical protein